MTVKITYKNKPPNNKAHNLVLFVDQKFNIISLKKYISSSDYSHISDLIKTRDLKQKILAFDISSKKKIILVSLKKDSTNSDLENLGANFYNQFKDSKVKDFSLNSETLSSNQKSFIGYFAHGLKLKSYTFEKYKTKKSKKYISLIITGKNKPFSKDQIKFKAIEDGTFYTRDLVSEPGNILHPDEYAKINEAGRTYWGEFGGERYIDELAQNAIAQMAKTNFRQRGLTDYEKYMVALARQRRMGMKKNENVIPFPKQD